MAKTFYHRCYFSSPSSKGINDSKKQSPYNLGLAFEKYTNKLTIRCLVHECHINQLRRSYIEDFLGEVRGLLMFEACPFRIKLAIGHTISP